MRVQIIVKLGDSRCLISLKLFDEFGVNYFHHKLKASMTDFLSP